MKNITKQESGWVLARVWLDAMEKAFRDFHGSRPRMYTYRAYEHATEAWLRILENEYGFKAKKAATIRGAVENYVEIGIKGGLFEDASQFELREVSPFRVEVKVFKCPYFDSCKDLLEEGVPVTNLTCARIGCFSAAVKLLANIDCLYDMDSIHIDDGCHGVIIKK